MYHLKGKCLQYGSMEPYFSFCQRVLRNRTKRAFFGLPPNRLFMLHSALVCTVFNEIKHFRDMLQAGLLPFEKVINHLSVTCRSKVMRAFLKMRLRRDLRRRKRTTLHAVLNGSLGPPWVKPILIISIALERYTHALLNEIKIIKIG